MGNSVIATRYVALITAGMRQDFFGLLFVFKRQNICDNNRQRSMHQFQPLFALKELKKPRHHLNPGICS